MTGWKKQEGDQGLTGEVSELGATAVGSRAPLKSSKQEPAQSDL